MSSRLLPMPQKDGHVAIHNRGKLRLFTCAYLSVAIWLARGGARAPGSHFNRDRGPDSSARVGRNVLYPSEERGGGRSRLQTIRGSVAAQRPQTWFWSRTRPFGLARNTIRGGCAEGKA